MPGIGLHLAVTLFFLAAVLKDDEFKPALPEIPIIGSGIELVILLFAVLTFVWKYNAHIIPSFLYQKAQIRK